MLTITLAAQPGPIMLLAFRVCLLQAVVHLLLAAMLLCFCSCSY